jgi:hypothetical protein
VVGDSLDKSEVSSEVGSQSEGSVEGRREFLGLGVSHKIVRNTGYMVGSHGGASLQVAQIKSRWPGR